MFTKMRVVTSLLLVLFVFGFLQLASGTLFFKALNDDRNSFIVSQLASKNTAAINDAYMNLNQSRVVLTRIQLRIASSKLADAQPDIVGLIEDSKAFQKSAADKYQLFKTIPDTPGQDIELVKHLDATYSEYSRALSQMQTALQANDLVLAGKLPVAPTQSAFLKDYNQWRNDQDRLTETGVAANLTAYQHMVWLLSTIMVVVLTVIALSWIGLRKILLNPLKGNIQHIQHIAKGDLTQAIDIEGRNEMSQLANSLHEMQQSLLRTVSNVRDGSDAIFTGASEISAGNNDLSARTEEQAASLEQTAASMEQLTATVKQNAENARQASQLALSASETAQKGGHVVQGVVRTMSDIAGSSKKIADIISVIDGIAFQTNILALNAGLKQHVPVSRGVDLPWSPVKCAAWRSAVLRQRKRSKA